MLTDELDRQHDIAAHGRWSGLFLGHSAKGMRHCTTISCENHRNRAHPDDRARAVLRAARHAVQRVPPHPRAHRARAPGRSRDLSLRPARVDAGAAGLSQPASAVGRPREDRSVAGQDPARRAAGADALCVARSRRRYDAIHSHEEGGLIGVRARRVLRVPHLYDMHSSLPQQLSNFAFSRSRLMRGVFLAIERLHDPALARRHRHLPVARGDRARDRTRAHARCSSRTRPARPRRRRRRPAPRRSPLVESRRRRRRWCCTPGPSRRTRGSTCCSRRWPSCTACAVTPAWCWPAASRTRWRRRAQQARAAGVEAVTLFAGERPASEIPAYLLAADVLVSPRSRGTNTPLKIYQYLRSGKPSSRRGC